MRREHPALAAHRAFYDAIETGDADLMRSLWADSAETSCVHPLSGPLIGTPAILRSWSLVMANVGYIQFFLTGVRLSPLPPGGHRSTAGDAESVVVTCTENILSDTTSADAFAGATVVATSILVLENSAGARRWRLWSRHASPVGVETEES